MKQTFLKLFIVLTLLLILPATGLQAAEIHKAASAGDLETVKRLLEQNPKLLQEMDENGRTPLHWACRGVHFDLVKYLVERGADVNARDNGAMAPLHSVASRGHLDAAKLLLAAGARVDAETKGGWTALHLAAANGHTAMAALLLDKGAHLDIRD
ncbi:MAG: ankyrin repeat domain-containing protein, partial [Candidatus Aminicenantes bacterium]|nr:ankyrin repeat domain-containing protein [Candidatus Aminicenantes bacterium]